MDSLIEDLLQLSRISRAELHLQPVDLSALARTIADELKQSDLSRNVEFNITPGLHAVGEQRLLRVVLENLLRNAWKFTSKKPTARIEFGRASGSRATFYVRDNGAGFDMRFADRLFGVFQRVHSSAEFPGTGIGLASVQRILHRHGGKAWAEGELQAGATFYFTLPSREDL
jgi:light-regulated signal transduction histidine kinase (bacteriophytochrome)